MRQTFERAAAAIVAAISAASLVLQYVLLLDLVRDGIGPAFGTLRFMSYFTILSNLLVLAATVSVALRARSRSGAWLRSPGVQSAIALYIGLTGLVYTFVLSALWRPQGAQWWADTGLHYATPLLYACWWAGCTRHGTLTWSMLPSWLVFPAVYLIWCFARGAWLHEYPYPFIDVDALGIATVLRNAIVVLVALLIGSCALMMADRVLARAADRTRPP